MPTRHGSIQVSNVQLLTRKRSTEAPSDALEGNAPTFKSVIKGHTDNLVNLPGPTGVPTFSSLAGGISQNVFAFMAEKERTQNFTCLSGEIAEQARFDFPKTVNILAVPKAVSLKQGWRRSARRWALAG